MKTKGSAYKQSLGATGGGPRGRPLSNEDCMVLDLIPDVEVDRLPFLETLLIIMNTCGYVS